MAAPASVPVFRYGYRATVGPLSSAGEEWLGEVEAADRHEALRKIQNELRERSGSFARSIELTAAQFGRLAARA